MHRPVVGDGSVDRRWIALVSSWLSSPTAPLHRTSIQGCPEQASAAPPNVAVPVVDRVEKLPGDCASAATATRAQATNAMSVRR
ncbi:MAG TPA: hypothetical protein VM782_00810, partial [Stellaceae bacterium]|nr:hypothetical protein [Stellaceae bacterium]